jgi:hypothetical protein
VTQTQPLKLRSFDDPDEVREGENWRLELLNLAGGAQVGRITVQPGWRWTENVRQWPEQSCVRHRTSSTRSLVACTR